MCSDRASCRVRCIEIQFGNSPTAQIHTIYSAALPETLFNINRSVSKCQQCQDVTVGEDNDEVEEGVFDEDAKGERHDFTILCSVLCSAVAFKCSLFRFFCGYVWMKCGLN